MHSRPVIALSAFALLAIALGGCADTSAGRLASEMLSSGDDKKQEAEADKPPKIAQQDELARSIQVAWVAARAERCGFYFKPEKLKASLMAYESTQGADEEALKKKLRAYDYTMTTIRLRIAGQPDYCSEKRLKDIRADLKRHLAGDFSLSAKPKDGDEKAKGDEFPTTFRP